MPTYKDAGVDIEKGAEFSRLARDLSKSTNIRGVVGEIGGFSGEFDLGVAGVGDGRLLASTDGVGSKLKIAQETGIFDTIGIDLVAMCVNDIAVTGTPLFFLDYLAVGKLSIERDKKILSGIVEACEDSGCALLGGETAEMPNVYPEDGFDLAGFAVGIKEDAGAMGPVTAGDAIIGIASGGLHANGFSLVLRIIQEQGIPYSAHAPFSEGLRLGEALLAPTTLYVDLCKKTRPMVKAFAHITGGGLTENIARILPETCVAHIDRSTIPFDGVFSWLTTFDISELEMLRTFNCGVGLVAIVARCRRDEVLSSFAKESVEAWQIGSVYQRVGVTPVVYTQDTPPAHS